MATVGPLTRPDRVIAPLELVLPVTRRADAAIRAGVSAMLAALAALAIWAGLSDYGIRVTSDSGSFLALIPQMGDHPFARQSPFLADPHIASPHATPYMQTLAFVWRYFGGEDAHPVRLARLLSFVGLAVFAFTLYAVFLYTRRLAGSRAAWLSLPVLLGLFGPAHVIWASDLTLHAPLYAGYYPQNVALAFALLTLLVLEGRSAGSLVVTTALVAATMLVHPFTGALLCVLATAESCRHALAGDRHQYIRAPIALTCGFALGTLWPAYSLDNAFAETGLRGVYVIALCAAAPFLVARLRSDGSRTRFRTAVTSLLERLASAEAARRLALLGAAGLILLGAWQASLLQTSPHDSVRLAVYWVEDRWRWPLMLVAGTVGINGLARLALRGRSVPAIWLAGCLTIGCAGALGLPLPVWYRFVLLCQVPLAIGVATALAALGPGLTRNLVAGTFALAIALKVATLVALPSTDTYLGSQLQPVWTLGQHIPKAPGLVATDPSTAYYIPAVSGHRVLTVGKGHVGSAAELAAAAGGYQLLHRFYAGRPDWWQAAQTMWRRGVRYVVLEKNTTLDPINLAAFTWKAALLKTPEQRRRLGNYYYENNRIGRVVYDSRDFVVYQLDPRKLFGGKKHV